MGSPRLTAALVRWVEPHAEGSGIPRIEAIVDGRTALGRARILPVKRFEHRSALAQAPSVVLVGLLCGLVGLVHNRGMLAGLAWADRSRIPRELRGLRGGDAGLHGAAQ